MFVQIYPNSRASKAIYAKSQGNHLCGFYAARGFGSFFPAGLVTDDQDPGNSAALSISVNVLSQQI